MIEWILSSCLLIAAVALIRVIFKRKIPARLQYALWGLVLLRLLVPVNFFQSRVSTENLVVFIERQPAVQSAASTLNSPAVSYDQAYQQAKEELEQAQPDTGTDVSVQQRAQEILEHSTLSFLLEPVMYLLWLSGAAAVTLCFLISNIRFARHLKRHRRPLEGTGSTCRVYICEGLDTPCLFGLIRPTIYVTPAEAADDVRLGHILAHETTHLRHLDPAWSVLRCLCLALHWYNPLVWLAARLSRRDCELACDEATIRRIGEDQRVSYGTTLIEMTCAKSSASGLLGIATTMTGSKTAIKERVIMIARKPKTALYTLIAVLLIAAITAGCAFSGVGSQNEPEVELPELTEEKKLELEEAFPYIFKGGNPSYWWYSESNPEGVRYYGNIDGFDFLYSTYDSASTADGTDYIGIAGEIFISSNHFVIYAYNDSEGDNYLHFMYTVGCIGQETVQKVAQIHNAYEKKLGNDWDRYYPNLDKITVADVTPSEEKKQEITDALGGWGYGYYGSYEGYDILFQSTPLTALGTIEIAGEYFRSGNIANLYGYKDGALHDLKELYEDGLISQKAIREIVQVHIAYTEKLQDEMYAEGSFKGRKTDIEEAIYAGTAIPITWTHGVIGANCAAYCGTYNGYDILYLNPHAAIDVYTPPLEIAGVSIHWATSSGIWGYQDGEIYIFREMYENGLLSDRDVAQIAEVINSYTCVSSGSTESPSDVTDSEPS